jgi:hypothetical protein
MYPFSILSAERGFSNLFFVRIELKPLGNNKLALPISSLTKLSLNDQ